MNKTDPLVSVILPVHNGAKYLKMALDSVFSQTYQALEIIVIDDGSEDDSASIVNSYRDLELIRQGNQGVAAARNVGIASAHGDFIAFIDQDDMWLPPKIETQVRLLYESDDLGYVLVYQKMFIDPGMTMPLWLKPDLFNIAHPAYIPSALMVRKAVFNKIGVFNHELIYASDSDWFARATKAGITKAIVEETLVHRRIHQANESRHIQANLNELLIMVKSSLDRQR